MAEKCSISAVAAPATSAPALVGPSLFPLSPTVKVWSAAAPLPAAAKRRTSLQWSLEGPRAAAWPLSRKRGCTEGCSACQPFRNLAEIHIAGAGSASNVEVQEGGRKAGKGSIGCVFQQMECCGGIRQRDSAWQIKPLVRGGLREYQSGGEMISQG